MNLKSKLLTLMALLVSAVPTIASAQVGAMLVTPDEAEASGEEQSLYYPNLATSEQMQTLPGMTEAIADAVIEARPFETMLELDALLAKHLDEAARKTLYVRFFEPINLNEATEAEVKLVPGIGPKMTHEFLEYPPYSSLTHWEREMGKYIEDEDIARFAQYVFVPVKLNAGTEEEILTIPGVGGRMAHEFEEYRPWTSMTQFRKEIGKYVDEKEVARLERYVVLDPVAEEE